MPKLNVRIVLQDDLSASWTAWFEGLHIGRTGDYSTCLSGEIADRSALHGLLERIRDLNLHLISVQVQPSTPGGNLVPSGSFQKGQKK